MKIKLYQIAPEKDDKNLMFMSYEFTVLHGGINADSYELVFDGDLLAQTAEDVFRIFNLEHPNGLSVLAYIAVSAKCKSTCTEAGTVQRKPQRTGQFACSDVLMWFGRQGVKSLPPFWLMGCIFCRGHNLVKSDHLCFRYKSAYSCHSFV